jgi:hypothetical protein
MFSIQAFEPIGQGNFSTRRGAAPYATIRIIVRHTNVRGVIDRAPDEGFAPQEAS